MAASKKKGTALEQLIVTRASLYFEEFWASLLRPSR
jgi:hypothetical protein